MPVGEGEHITEQFLTRLRHLRLDKAQGGTKPYKPILVLSVLVLIAKQKISDPRIFLDGGLKAVFHQLLELLFPGRFEAADPRYPFRHLENDGIWQLVPATGHEDALLAGLSASSKARQILKHVACAELPPEIFYALQHSNEFRTRAIQTICVSIDMQFGVDAYSAISRLLTAAPPIVPPMPERETLSERALEEHLARNFQHSEIGKLGVSLAREVTRLPSRQVLTPVNSIDLLGFAPMRREWWVIELKRGRPPDSVVGQVSRYMGWIAANHAASGEKVVGAVVVGNSEAKLEFAVRANASLSLWAWNDDLLLKRVI